MDTTSDLLFLLVLVGGPIIVSLAIVGGALIRIAGEFFGTRPRHGRRPLI
jgi:hypothetical protein